MLSGIAAAPDQAGKPEPFTGKLWDRIGTAGPASVFWQGNCLVVK